MKKTWGNKPKRARSFLLIVAADAENSGSRIEAMTPGSAAARWIIAIQCEIL
jgi:hypothetical protein